jgi:hypothetical protein
LAYNFNNDTPPLPSDPQAAAPSAPADAENAVPTTSDTPQSAGLLRFRACRWMQPAENGYVEFCTHREVKPYAGSSSFDADAWCPDCQYYKLRRVPKKRSPDDYRY